MSRPLTLMAVHAHPDDEATSTGGVLAKYAAEGVTTVLVTCTDGALGDAGTVKPGEEGHSTAEVVAARAAELAESCAILGVTHAHQLGYHDSGMMGWPQNDADGAFWTTPPEEPVARLAELIERHRPDVVVTYDENGFYGHPDHIQAHRVTVAALDRAGSGARLYYSTIRRSDFARFGELVREAGEEFPEPEEGQEMPDMGVADDEVAVEVDVTAFAGAKRDALAAHASQVENIFFLKLSPETFTAAMGHEAFVQARPPRAPGGPVADDLFHGLR
ncbi:PIG-L family deacetylase [Klenkia brasiliensis]|uniref:N-acetylglucosaminyl deacetylase, LmbE family n=1 Tax=Klenkia brasiliensis TaxID=333142 RepID=A0A1G7PAG0_9ACTN|nr:PIG-L family deacetylase [Klenkia brasiliensis]SDF83292.1 N-acetylglucosaminyl deacetylase, LmbE family [Klenkia brasiliensis]